MTVMEHLEELRRRIVICCIAIAVCAVAAWFLYPPFFNLVQHPYCNYVNGLPKHVQPPNGCAFYAGSMLSPMLVKIQIVVYIAIAIALPVLLYQLWAFIVPGLNDREKRMSIPFIASSVLLFALGATVAFIMLPKGLNFLLGFAGSGVVPLLTFDHYVTFVFLLTVAFGVSFLFPVLLVFLMLVGVVNTGQLRKVRRYAILGIAIFAAVITPSSDPYTMMALMIPLVVFYEAAIIIGRLMKR
jgi:sec-independent protein translocase protein TatC